MCMCCAGGFVVCSSGCSLTFFWVFGLQVSEQGENKNFQMFPLCVV